MNVMNSITANGVKCCVGPPLKSCKLVVGRDGCPLQTLAHSVEMKNGKGFVMT